MRSPGSVEPEPPVSPDASPTPTDYLLLGPMEER